MTLVTLSSIANSLDNYEPILPTEVPLGPFVENEFIDVLVDGQVVHIIGDDFDNDFFLRVIVYSKDQAHPNKVLVEDSLIIPAKTMTCPFRMGVTKQNPEVETLLSKKIELKLREGDIIFRMPAQAGLTGTQLLDIYVIESDYAMY